MREVDVEPGVGQLLVGLKRSVARGDAVPRHDRDNLPVLRAWTLDFASGGKRRVQGGGPESLDLVLWDTDMINEIVLELIPQVIPFPVKDVSDHVLVGVRVIPAATAVG